MNDFFHENTIKDLIKQIKRFSDRIILPPKNSSPRQLSEDQATRIIQQTWRNMKTRKAMIKTPFHSYRSMISPDEKQYQLSSLMFGHHVAEQIHDAKEQISNPVVTVEYYHRSTILNNPVLDTLYKEFELDPFDKEKYDYYPITLLKNNPINDVLDLFRKIENLKLVKKEPYTVAILILPKSEDELSQKLKDKIKNMGLIASSWEIAENIRSSIIDISTKKHKKISLSPNLPKSIKQLINSEIMSRIQTILDRKKEHSTILLTICLKKILSDLPPNLSTEAIQRIATMVDFTNTFYLDHYPRYAQCIYYVLHEVSLALIENTQASFLEQEYQRFKQEASSTLNQILSINKENLSNYNFLATASTSGASACSVAMRIASKMLITNDAKPKVKIFKPCYYELPNTFNLDNTEDAQEADVLMISAGPIVNPEGLTPGTDINGFIKHHIINSGRKKPVTLIIDATTALYKNLQLNDEVQQLITKGQLSIIIHESHQKFGLIHSDQAQYGRVFGWCSKKHFSNETLEDVERNSKADFVNHSDIRIGSFINTRCDNTLERIKEKHFANGALLRNLLLGTSIISEHIEKHDDMQEDLDELYFLTNQETAKDSYVSNMEYAAYGAVEYRNSFGHYSLTTASAAGLRRLSPDASDSIDNLLLASHMRIARQYNYSSRKMLELLTKENNTSAKLNLEQQIALVGMLHCISSFFPIIPRAFGQAEYLERTLKTQDKSKIIDSGKKPKDIIVSKYNDVTYLGFHSHGKLFRQIAIKDLSLTAALKPETINSPNTHELIQDHFNALQKTYLPMNLSLAQVFATISNILACCPDIEGRPFMMDIQIWLKSLHSKLIAEFQPIKPAQFIRGIKALYSTTLDEESRNYGLIFLSRTNAQIQFPLQTLQNKDFIKAIKKVYEGNAEILKSLRSAPHKYQAAQESSKAYLSNCFDALHKFYSQKAPTPDARANLLNSIKKAEEDYLDVLAQDRSTLSQALRYMLKAITNFIASLTLGAAHYLNYKSTGELFFYNGTRSATKLKNLDKALIEDISEQTEASLTPAT